MTTETREQRVHAMLDDAVKNEYDIRTWSVDDIVADLLAFAELEEGEGEAELRPHVASWKAKRFDYDLAGLIKFEPGEEFLGLYLIAGKHVVWIVNRATEETAGFRFLARDGSPHPYYVPDPIAWARIPKP